MGKEYEEIKAEVSDANQTEIIDDIVTTALEGGICYWCKRAEVKGKYLGEFAFGADRQRRNPGTA